jgi:hypothetical protein
LILASLKKVADHDRFVKIDGANRPAVESHSRLPTRKERGEIAIWRISSAAWPFGNHMLVERQILGRKGLVCANVGASFAGGFSEQRP